MLPSATTSFRSLDREPDGAETPVLTADSLHEYRVAPRTLGVFLAGVFKARQDILGKSAIQLSSPADARRWCR